MDRLREAIVWMIQEGMGELDDSQQAVVDAFNALPNVEPINWAEDGDERDGDW